MEKMILRAIKRYLKRHYPAEMKRIINRAAALKPRLMAKAPDLGGFMNINHKGTLFFLRNCLYKSYRKYAEKVAEKQEKGEWTDTWGMIVNPNNTDEGIAFTLVGCPLADYAKKYGYEELMPHMCTLDHAYAKIMHARLIRTHTVAAGSDSCDYWYVPDRSATALNFRGKII